MKIEFKHLKIHGFLSISDAELDLNDKGIVKVYGINNSPGSATSNGSGKSSIFEALYFALTGKTIRGTTDFINIYDKTGYADVSLSLSVDATEYLIRRTRNHPDVGSNLFIEKDGKDISGDKLKKTELILEQCLPKVNSNLLTSVVILGQGLPNKFTSLTPIKRKERLEELAETSEFIKKFRDDVSSLNKDTTLSLTDKQVQKAAIDSRIDHSNQLIAQKSKKLESYSNDNIDIDSLESTLEKKKKQLKELDDTRKNLQSTYNSLTDELSKMNNDYTFNYVNKLEKLNQDGTSLYNEKNKLINSKVCPTCGRPYDDSTIQTIDNNAKLLDDKMQKLLVERGKVSEEGTYLKGKIEDKSSECNLAKSKLDSLPSSISLIDETSNISNKISEYKLVTGSLKDDIIELQKTTTDDKKALKTFNKDIEQLEVKKNILNYLNKISNKEFRSYMLRGIVDYLDTRVRHYGSVLFGTNDLSITLDEKGRLFVQYNNRQYESLSGGERQKADIATQFSIRDMLMYGLGFSCNLIVLDESFDNLDDAGTSSLLNLITNMNDLNSIYVVSHHEELPIPFDTKIDVVKGIDNMSVIKLDED